jgi:hypothetical protein
LISVTVDVKNFAYTSVWLQVLASHAAGSAEMNSSIVKCRVRKRVAPIAGLLLLSSAASWAASPDAFQLWEANPITRFIELDIDSSTEGVEWIVLGVTEETSSIGGGFVETANTVQLKVRSPDGKSNVGTLSRSVNASSGSYPDPGNAWEEQICYGSDAGFYCPYNGESTSSARDRVVNLMDLPLGFGIADTAAGEKLVVGIGAAIEWVGQDVEEKVGNFRVFVYDAHTLNYNCKIKLPRVDNYDYELEWSLGSVGDYLSSNGRNGMDEIRIILDNDFDRWRIKFYDPADCSVISSTSTKNPVP